MSKARWAGLGLLLLGGYVVPAMGCGSDDGTPGGGGDGGGGDAGTCSTAVQVLDCNTVSQNGVTFTVACNSTFTGTLSGRATCVRSDSCTATGCLDPATTTPCLSSCSPRRDGAAASALGGACATNNDCGTGFSCLKPTDNLVPGAGPPNGLCTLECTTAATQTQCESFGGVCVGFSAASSKAFCVESCNLGPPPPTKCHGRRDTACAPLDKSGFACIPMCADDSECGSRKCDIGTGLCSDAITAGAPVGGACMRNLDCNGGVCIPLGDSDGGPSPGACTASCRLGSAGCGFRPGALDAGPAVGACLLVSTDSPNATEGDVGFCAQLCDTTADCTVQDPKWACVQDPDVQTTFKHGGYCMFAPPSDGGREASTPPREASADVQDAPADSNDAVAPPPDSAGVDVTTPPTDGAVDVTPPADGGTD